ncbi:MAG: exodeoxyribonuclease III [Prevotella sp.]
MKFISWNVNGLRACVGKGFVDIFTTLNADFFCLQETKMQAGQLDLTFPGYHSFWNYADKKGYSGTAIFTRHTPLNVTYGIGIDEHDHEGRVVTLEMDDFYLVTCYTPNSQDELKRLEYRMRWERDFQAYIRHLDEKKPVIVCGDLNVAHEDIDLKNPKTNHTNAGFSDDERRMMSQFLGKGFGLEATDEPKGGFIDTFRELYPDTVTYSWWSYRFQARAKNTGWRIDYFIASERLRDRIKDATIHTDILGSDHCPVGLELY